MTLRTGIVAGAMLVAPGLYLAPSAALAGHLNSMLVAELDGREEEVSDRGDGDRAANPRSPARFLRERAQSEVPGGRDPRSAREHARPRRLSDVVGSEAFDAFDPTRARSTAALQDEGIGATVTSTPWTLVLSPMSAFCPGFSTFTFL